MHVKKTGHSTQVIAFCSFTMATTDEDDDIDDIYFGDCECHGMAIGSYHFSLETVQKVSLLLKSKIRSIGTTVFFLFFFRCFLLRSLSSSKLLN